MVLYFASLTIQEGEQNLQQPETTENLGTANQVLHLSQIRKFLSFAGQTARYEFKREAANMLQKFF